jgi:2-oxoisovalerate dehydrogenase E1 component
MDNEFNKYLKKAFFIREFESHLLSLFKKGELNGTVHTCVGQELTPVVLSSFLKKGDRIFSNHRGHGHFLSFGGNPKELMAEMLGLETGTSKGIGGSQHLMNEGFISNGIQGGLSPIATGYSYANKMMGNDFISVVFLGDGTLGAGILYEALNLASVFESPVLFVLENNKYAQSTSSSQTIKGSIQKRIEGFGINYANSSIWDIDDLEQKFSSAISEVRKGKPAFLEIECYRLNSHSKGDDNREINEIESYAERDLLNVFSKSNPEIVKEHVSAIQAELHEIYLQCKSEKQLLKTRQHEYIFSESVKYTPYQPASEESDNRINKLIYEGLKDLLTDNENSILIGEDIQHTTKFTPQNYGGAFKVTQNLSDLFPGKVFNTPISEAGIIGFGIGAALNKCKTVVEIMFGDFLTLGLDQILQQASKIPEMFGQNVELPLIIRTPMGGRRGYGPTHSQNIEKYFLFIPNVNVFAVNSVLDPRILYKQIGTQTQTSIVIEDKICYTKFFNKQKLRGYRSLQTDETFPTLVFEPETIRPTHTFVVYGGMLDETLDALPKLFMEEIFPRIICPSRICPLNIKPVIDSLEIAEKLIFIEEGSKYGSLSSEIISFLTQNRIPFKLESRISNEAIIPCSKTAELNTIPNSELITNTILSVI